MLIVAYGTVSSTVNKFTNLGIDQKLASVYRTEILEKRARLAYYNIEDNKTWDLITRVCKEPEIRIRNAFCNILDLAEIIVRVGSLLLLITAQVWWAGLALLAISVPLFLVSKRPAKRVHGLAGGGEAPPPRGLFEKRDPVAGSRGRTFPLRLHGGRQPPLAGTRRPGAPD